MPIITISRGSNSMGRAVAQGVAERLGYECLDREVLAEASEQFQIPEINLSHAISDAPSILERFTHSKHRYTAFVQSALARHMCGDNVVYHGLLGHLLLRDIPNLLKVRIVADLELRLSVVMERMGVGRSDALSLIETVDREREKWTKSLYGVNPWDATLYHLVLSIPRFSVEDAVELICRAVEMEQFQSTPESRHRMEDLALAFRVKAMLIEKHPSIKVVVTYGNALVYGVTGDREVGKLTTDIAATCTTIKGLNNIEVHADVPAPADAV